MRWNLVKTVDMLNAAVSGRRERNMTFREILLSHGIAEELITTIRKHMSKNRIFLTKEEKIEERYQKLKWQREEQKIRLDHSIEVIQELRSQLKEKEKLITARQSQERWLKHLEKQFDSEIADLIISVAIKKKLSGARYPELLLQKFDKSKITINSEGIVEGIDEQLPALKEMYLELFYTQEDKEEFQMRISKESNSEKEDHQARKERRIQHDQ